MFVKKQIDPPAYFLFHVLVKVHKFVRIQLFEKVTPLREINL